MTTPVGDRRPPEPEVPLDVVPPVGHELRQSPLRAVHLELGARLVEFGGWEMPLSYTSGTIAEHLACRRDSVVFDVSHLGTVRLTGPEAYERLQLAFTNDLARIGPGRAQYTHLLDDSDASVIDDIIVWWTAPESFDVMPNASNTSSVLDAIGGTDVTSERVILAVQGPEARRRLASVAPAAASVGRFSTAEFDFGGQRCTVAGTGYTGEDGVECAVPIDVAEEFLRSIVAAGVTPAGLGARDTLRLEAGLPLHGHELGPGITPLQAGLGWVVGWEKPAFRGREALQAERATGPRRRLRGLLAKTRRPLHAGERCVDSHGRREVESGNDLGVVSSGNFSPVLERGIGLAFLPPALEDGVSLDIVTRSGTQEVTVVRPPFQLLRL